MSRRQELQQRLHTLAEINSIMGAMKNLSLIETRKLSRILDHQQQALANIDRAAADFLHFHPQPAVSPIAELVLIIGSERGFCGDFNEELIEAMAAGTGTERFVLVGRRLALKLEEHPRVVASIEGPTVTEEVTTTMNRLVEQLEEAESIAGIGLKALCHDADGDICVRSLLPMPAPLPHAGPAEPPQLNLPPVDLFRELADHYLFAALHQMFYSSLMAENHRRLQHMEGAIRQMEHTIDEAKLKYNALRQEEITEEIEVIMLSAEALLEQAGSQTALLESKR